MSEVWQDLGYHSKTNNLEGPSIYKSYKGPHTHEHETPEQTEARKLKNLLLLHSLKPECEEFIEEEKCIKIKVKNRRFEFWPATDTYFIHSSNHYGHEIDRLIHQIKERLIKQ